MDDQKNDRCLRLVSKVQHYPALLYVLQVILLTETHALTPMVARDRLGDGLGHYNCDDLTT